MQVSRAPPYRLPHLRLRHPVRLHRPRHDHADAAVARRVRRHRRAAASSKFLQDARHQGDLVHPGFTIESWPRESEAVVDGGHEVGHHSWAHIPPANQSRAEEEADLLRANEAIARLTGRNARGYRSPSWDLSEHTIDLLLQHGFQYNSSLMGADYLPYRARRGDVAKLGEPFHFGEPTSLIEMPISWSLDDYPHFEFVRTPTSILPGLQPASAVMDSWFDEFLYMQKTVDWGVLTYTMHPFVIGRGYRMLALEGLVDRLGNEGAVFMTMEDAAREAAAKLSGVTLRPQPR